MILYFLRHASAGEHLVNPKKDEKRALDAGAKAFLQKPVDDAELLAVVRQALGEGVRKEAPTFYDLGRI